MLALYERVLITEKFPDPILHGCTGKIVGFWTGYIEVLIDGGCDDGIGERVLFCDSELERI